MSNHRDLYSPHNLESWFTMLPVLCLLVCSIDELPIRNTLRKYYAQKAAMAASTRQASTVPPRSTTNRTASSGGGRKKVGSKHAVGGRSPQARDRPSGVKNRRQANVQARNAQDYLKKYYGHASRLYSISDGEVDYGSDRWVVNRNKFQLHIEWTFIKFWLCIMEGSKITP